MIKGISKLPGIVRSEAFKVVKPMLATQIDKPFNDKEWIYESKMKWLQDYRIQAKVFFKTNYQKLSELYQ